MFSKLIETNWIDKWIEDAKIESRKEDLRDEHRVLHDMILDFMMARKDWVIDNVDLLTTDNIIRTFSIYTEDAARVSNKLSNVIVAKYPFVVLRTVEPKYHFIINVNGQDIVNIRDLSKLMKISYLNPIIKKYTVELKSWNIPVLPPDIYLMELYHKRYNPAFHEEWKQIDNDINQMIKLMEDRLKTGGSPAGKIQEGVNYIRKQLLDKFKNSDDVIVCGSYIVSVLQNRKEVVIPSMQLLSKMHVSDLFNLLKGWFEVEGRFTLILVNQNLHAPFDFRLRKYTVYLKVSGEQRPLLDIFTSLQYEQIPYFEYEDVKYAHPFVALRFIYMDIWIIRVMLQEGKIDQDKLRVLMQKKSELAATIKQFDVPLNKWIGQWTNENTDYKIMALKKRQETDLPTYPYKPYIYFIKHKKYRDF